MNPHFRWLVGEARAAGLHVMDRLNPTIIEEPGYEWVGAFLAAQRVEAVASLPCYSQQNVDEQRGEGVFDVVDPRAAGSSTRSATARTVPAWSSTWSTTRTGAFLPPAQARSRPTTAPARRELRHRASTGCSRWPTCRSSASARGCCRKGQFDDLHGHARGRAPGREPRRGDVPFADQRRLPGLSVRLRLQPDAAPAARACAPALAGADRPHLRDLLDGPMPRRIATAEHCYGCTAGQGSSCGGALH